MEHFEKLARSNTLRNSKLHSALEARIGRASNGSGCQSSTRRTLGVLQSEMKRKTSYRTRRLLAFIKNATKTDKLIHDKPLLASRR